MRVRVIRLGNTLTAYFRGGQPGIEALTFELRVLPALAVDDGLDAVFEMGRCSSTRFRPRALKA